MKTIFKISKHLVLILLLAVFSCSSDDDSSPNPGEDNGINAVNFTKDFDENPVPGASIGAIQAASDNTLNFSITSQTPSGAMSINTTTGELKVSNAAVFDFETYPVIIATISIITSNGTTSVTATVNLNDLDDIASLLTTSEADYLAATNGDWIIITAAEYNALATKLNEVSKAGTTDAAYNPGTPISISNSTEWTVANVTTANLANNSYVFALKYHAKSVINNSTTKVKVSSTSYSDGYTDLGNTLPTHSGTEEDLYFVLKGSNTMTTDIGYLAFYKPSGSVIGLVETPENEGDVYLKFDDAYSGLTLLHENRKVLYQGLSSTQKQW
ncbi:cadherin repeat domain-containing protein [Bizionia arctica]|uniref:Cadherin repeat domain-containing protein n=1 Tax=Bizionia arctica TaxID=1495645 RepID=A0A917LJM1_9FLAO|nr:cadherin repeat domain-containing protein [Bizionia arctica]GGG32280.1 hypothetical protein GCM10010976_00100 [Bizionia arctica]